MPPDHEQKNKAAALNARIGRRLAYYRSLRGISQTRLGEEVGVSFQQIQKYERGKNRVSASMLQMFAQILDVPVIELFGEAHGWVADKYTTRLSTAKMRLIDTIVNSNDHKLDCVIESLGELLYGIYRKN